MVAGEEEHLALLGELLQECHGRLQAGVVKAEQGVVQDQRGLGGDSLGHGQAEGKVQLIRRSLTAPESLPQGVFLRAAGAEGQVRIQAQPVVFPLGQPGQIFLGLPGNAGGKAALQRLGSLGQGILGQRQGGLVPLQRSDPLVQLGQAGGQLRFPPQRLHFAPALAVRVMQGLRLPVQLLQGGLRLGGGLPAVVPLRPGRQGAGHLLQRLMLPGSLGGIFPCRVQRLPAPAHLLPALLALLQALPAAGGKHLPVQLLPAAGDLLQALPVGILPLLLIDQGVDVVICLPLPVLLGGGAVAAAKGPAFFSADKAGNSHQHQ